MTPITTGTTNNKNSLYYE